MSKAILVIDLQVGLFSEAGEPFDYQPTIDRINQLTTKARQCGHPVIFIQHEQPEGPLQHNSPGWALVHDLVTGSEDVVVRKTTPNSFLKTRLSEVLEERQISELIVCGYATEFCVDSTVRAAAALGYQIQLVADGHTTHHKSHARAEMIREHHNQTLSSIQSFGVHICAREAAAILGDLATGKNK